MSVNTRIISAKLSNNKNLNKSYKIIRKNKLGYADFAIPSNSNLENYIQQLEQDPNIESIDLSINGEYLEMIPNDTYYNEQWYLSKIKIPQTWDFCSGNSNIIVAVLDSGTEWDHSDIGFGNDNYNNIYLNSGEDAWTDPNDPTTGNGIDDDNNGLIDDWKGWNYADTTNDTRTSYSHGTFVAGIISAKTNNNHGISGIAGGNNDPGVRILPYCIGKSAPISSVLDDAIIDAVDKGAKVIQLSLHVPSSNAIDAAIQYATDNNVLIVCATGNSSLSSIFYPASNPNIIAVGALSKTFEGRVAYSNYGINLDLLAPGNSIYSTVTYNKYRSGIGTSYAAPQVTAVIALMYSINPDLNRSEIIETICSTAQKIGKYDYDITSGKPYGSWNIEMGYGVIDAYASTWSVCQSSFTDQSIIVNTSINGCSINIDNVNVGNNSKFSVDASYETIIDKDFEVNLGSELEINVN